MSKFPLDEATELTELSDGRLKADGAAAYWNFQSAFGGWALALASAAIQTKSPQRALLASSNALFMKPLPENGLVIDVRSLREGRRTNFLRAEFFSDEGSGDPVFAADMVFSDIGEKELNYTLPFPEVKSPDESPRLPDSPGPKFLSRYEQRVGLGTPFTNQEHPHSAVWVRDAAGRAWDEKALLAVSDTPMPRSFFLDTTPRFGATVTYDLHVLCSRADLEAQGNEFLLVEATADRVISGRYSQTTRIWSRKQQLIAVSKQLAFY